MDFDITLGLQGEELRQTISPMTLGANLHAECPIDAEAIKPS